MFFYNDDGDLGTTDDPVYASRQRLRTLLGARRYGLHPESGRHAAQDPGPGAVGHPAGACGGAHATKKSRVNRIGCIRTEERFLGRDRIGALSCHWLKT